MLTSLNLRLIFVCVFVFSIRAQAQYAAPPAYSMNSTCNMEINPHSYACHAYTFNGQSLFPLNPIEWKSQIEGEWKTLTYANPWTGNEGSEFEMVTDAMNSSLPLGVMNKETQDMVGSLTIKGDKIKFKNWQGHQLKSYPGTVQISDQYTFKFAMEDEPHFQQSFICRDFNRNNKHHLICSWFLVRLYNGYFTHEHRAYFGFIKDTGLQSPPQLPPPAPPVVH